MPVTVTDTADQDTLDRLATRLQRACALLLILAVLHMGRLVGLFAFLASAFVLFCAAPGAQGMARAARRRTRICAALTAILAAISFVKNATALTGELPHRVAAEAKMHCDSVPNEVAEGLVVWGTRAWQVHKHLRHNHTGTGHFNHDEGMARSLAWRVHSPPHDDISNLTRHEEKDKGAATDVVERMTGQPRWSWPDRMLQAVSGEAPREAFSQPSFCARAERIARCATRAVLVAGAALSLLTLLVAVHVGVRARQLARAAGLGCACKRCPARQAVRLPLVGTPLAAPLV